MSDEIEIELRIDLEFKECGFCGTPYTSAVNPHGEGLCLGRRPGEKATDD